MTRLCLADEQLCCGLCHLTFGTGSAHPVRVLLSARHLFPSRQDLVEPHLSLLITSSINSTRRPRSSNMSQQPQALSEGEQAALAEQTQPTETEVAELQTGEFNPCRHVDGAATLAQLATFFFTTDIHHLLQL